MLGGFVVVSRLRDEFFQFEVHSVKAPSGFRTNVRHAKALSAV